MKQDDLKSFLVKGFTGVNTTNDPLKIWDTDLVKCENWRVLEDAILKRMLGMVKFSGLDEVASAQIDGLYQYIDNDMNKHWFCVCNGYIWKYNSVGPVWDQVTEAGITLTSGKSVNFLTWQGNCYFANGEKIIRYGDTIQTEHRLIYTTDDYMTLKEWEFTGVASTDPLDCSTYEYKIINFVHDYITGFYYAVAKLNGANEYYLFKIKDNVIYNQVLIDWYTSDVHAFICGIVQTDAYIFLNHFGIAYKYEKSTLTFIISSTWATDLGVATYGYGPDIIYKNGSLWVYDCVYLGTNQYRYDLVELDIDLTEQSRLQTFTNTGLSVSANRINSFDFIINSDDKKIIYFLEIDVIYLVYTFYKWDEETATKTTIDTGSAYPDRNGKGWLSLIEDNNIEPIILYGIDYDSGTTTTTINSYFDNSYTSAFTIIGDLDYHYFKIFPRSLDVSKKYRSVYELPDINISKIENTTLTDRGNIEYYYIILSGDEAYVSKRVSADMTDCLFLLSIDLTSIFCDVDRIFVLRYEETGGTTVKLAQIENPTDYIIYLLDKSLAGSTSVIDFETTENESKYIEQHQNHMFYVEENSSIVNYTEAYSDNVYEGQEPIAEDDGDVISGIKSYSGRLLVFKKKGIYSFDGIVGNHFISKVSEEFGIVSNKTVKELDQEIIALSYKGFISIYGNSVKLLSERKIGKNQEKLGSYFRYGEDGAINRDYIHLAHSEINETEKEYICWVPIGSSQKPDYGLIWNYGNNTFYTKNKDKNIMASARIDDDSGNPQVLLGDDEGFIYQDEYGNRNVDQPIKTEIITKKYAVGDLIRDKYFRKLFILSKQYFEMGGAYKVDNGEWYPFEITQGGDQDFLTNLVRIYNGRGKTLQFKMLTNDKKEPPEISGFEIKYKQLASTGRGR